MKRINICLIILIFFTAKISCEPHTSPYTKKVIAVMPFTNLTGRSVSGDFEWLSNAIATTITAKLNRINSICLVERAEIKKILEELKLQYSGLIDENSVKTLGRLLGADLLILGEYQIANNEIRITSRLVEVESGKIFWTSEVTDAIENILYLGDKIVYDLLKYLCSDFSIKERAKIVYKPTKTLRAYELLTKGDEAFYNKEFSKAEMFYREAILIDQECDPAFNNLAAVYSEKGDYKTALEFCKKSIELNPEYVEAWTNLGAIYDSIGFYDDAIECFNKAISIDPTLLSTYINLKFIKSVVSKTSTIH